MTYLEILGNFSLIASACGAIEMNIIFSVFLKRKEKSQVTSKRNLVIAELIQVHREVGLSPTISPKHKVCHENDAVHAILRITTLLKQTMKKP